MFLKAITTKLSTLGSPVNVYMRRITTTTSLQKIFTIQSVEDFEEKVRNSKTPVVVDFFAT